MKYTRLAIAILLAVFILVACQSPNQNPPGATAGKWDESIWNESQWE